MRHLPLAIPGAWQGLPERVFAPQRGAFRGSPGGFPLFSQFFRLTCISLQYARRRIVLLMLLGLLKQKKPDALSGLHSKAKIFLGEETDRAGKRIPCNLSFSKVYQNPVAKQAWIWFALRSFCKLAPSAVQTLEPPQITRDPKETFPATCTDRASRSEVPKSSTPEVDRLAYDPRRTILKPVFMGTESLLQSTVVPLAQVSLHEKLSKMDFGLNNPMGSKRPALPCLSDRKCRRRLRSSR